MHGEQPEVLIVHADPGDRLALDAVFADPGRSLARAGSAAEALRLLDGADFAAVLLDVRARGADGFETARLVRERPRSRHTPIVFLAAPGPPPFPLREAYRLGAVDYVVDPHGADVLAAKVASFVEVFRRGGDPERAGRERAETALAASEGRFRTLAETIPHLAWIARPDGHIYWYNRRWYEYTETTPEGMEGWGWQSVHDPAVLPDVVARWGASIATGEPFDMVFPLKGRDGAFRPFLTLVMPLKDAAGRVVEWFGTNTDVTAQKAAEDVLREEGRRKDEFIALFAHELRNPLAPISNAVHLLSLRPDPGTVARATQMIDRQVKQLTHIVDDLFDFSEVAHGKVALRRDRVDLADLARTVSGDEAARFGTAGIALAVRTPETPVWVTADRTRLTQLLSNLLGNAGKFTPGGGRVEVAVGADGPAAVLTVRDNGRGIEPDLMGRLFRPFTQADQGLARSQGGLGLGLALVKGIAELHGGTVRAESGGDGAGAAFIVSLPRAGEPSALDPGRPTGPPPAPSGRRLRVLVIEDNRDSADSLMLLLEVCGCDATVAYTGPDGLAAARAARPDLILCDIGLPGMSGYEIARELSAARPDKEPLLVALTGYGRAEDRERAAASGFDRHFVKPMDPTDLTGLLAGVRGPAA